MPFTESYGAGCSSTSLGPLHMVYVLWLPLVRAGNIGATNAVPGVGIFRCAVPGCCPQFSRTSLRSSALLVVAPLFGNMLEDEQLKVGAHQAFAVLVMIFNPQLGLRGANLNFSYVPCPVHLNRNAAQLASACIHRRRPGDPHSRTANNRGVDEFEMCCVFPFRC